MHFFGSHDEDVEYGALIDIGSGSIGIGIVESKKIDPHPKLMYTYRAPLRLYTEAHKESPSDTRKVREALLANALQFFSEGLQVLREYSEQAKIKRVFVTCSAPWAYTTARSVQYEANESFKITKEIVQNLVKSAEEEIRTNIRENPAMHAYDFAVVEKATVDMSVNGYAVAESIGLTGKTLGLTHITGLIPKDIIQTTHEVHDKLFPETELHMHTCMLVMYCVLRDIFPDIHSTCIIDVTGEATEFGIVENDLLIDNAHIPFGTNTLLRMLSEQSGRPVADVRTSVVECSSQGTLELKEFEPFTSAYSKHVEAHIDAILKNRPLPEHIVLISDTQFTEIFKTILESALQKVTGKPYAVSILDTHIMEEVGGKNELKKNDIYLTVAARFFHKLHGCAEISVED